MVIALALAIVIFFGQLSITAESYQQELDSIYTNTEIRGRYTDIKGRQIDNLVANSLQIYDLYHSERIDDLTVTLKYYGLYLGTPLSHDGISKELPPYTLSLNPYAFEGQMRKFSKDGGGILVTAVNDVFNAPEFYYIDKVQIEFLEFLLGANRTMSFGCPAWHWLLVRHSQNTRPHSHLLNIRFYSLLFTWRIDFYHQHAQPQSFGITHGERIARKHNDTISSY